MYEKQTLGHAENQCNMPIHVFEVGAKMSHQSGRSKFPQALWKKILQFQSSNLFQDTFNLRCPTFNFANSIGCMFNINADTIY